MGVTVTVTSDPESLAQFEKRAQSRLAKAGTSLPDPWRISSSGVAHDVHYRQPEVTMPTSKRVMKATLVSVLMLGAAVLATTDSRGQSGRPLTPEQASAKAAFDEEMARAVKGMKDKCGSDLAVTTDFENYDRSTFANSGGKGDEGGGKGRGGAGGGGDQGHGNKNKEGDASEEWKADQRSPQGALYKHRLTCRMVVDSLSEVCAKQRSPSSTPHLPEVKGVACLLGGWQPPQENDRLEDRVQRNMSFSNGVLTFHIGSSMAPNLRDNVFLALTPLADKTSRMNGIQCSKALDCRSGVCSKGSCTACGPQAACSGQTETCGKAGICFHKLTPAEAERERDEEEARLAARASEPSDSRSSGGSNKTAKKGIGATCASNSECASKICGTLKSPGGNHKCGTKR